MKYRKAKYLSAVVALMVSGPAFAAFNGDQSAGGSSSLLFNAYESVSGYSFTLDTGSRRDDFSASAPSFASLNFNLAGDANWNAFLSGVGASHLSDIRWAVSAGDTSVVDGDLRSYLTTASNGVDIGTNGNGTTNAQLNQWSVNYNAFINASNGGDGTVFGFAGQPSTFHLKEGPTDYASYEITIGSNWSGKSKFDTIGALGETLNFYEANITLSSNGSVSNLAKITTDLLGTATLTNDGLLTIVPLSPVSPVPEADTWAMLLAGLGLLGMIVRRRSGSVY